MFVMHETHSIMQKTIYITLFLFFSLLGFSQPKVIHVFTALCDNENQGIVPVPKQLGKGDDPANNLYWGAYYGIKGFFKRHKDWKLVKTENVNTIILERIIFFNEKANTYLVADAYEGSKIDVCIQNYILSLYGVNQQRVQVNSTTLLLGKDAHLLAYTGHDGLMEFDVDVSKANIDSQKRPSITLACYSKEYFTPYFQKCNTNPLVWTNGLMAPEAYTLLAGIEGWLQNETNTQIKERAAQAYNQYQKCGIRGARNLFSTGY